MLRNTLRAMCALLLFGLFASAQSLTDIPKPAIGIEAFSPQQGQRGTTVTVTMMGGGFTPDMVFSVSPANGIETLNVVVVSKNKLQATLQIAASASLVPRRLSLSRDGKTVVAPMQLQIVDAPPSQDVLPQAKDVSSPKVNLISPNQIAADTQNVELTIQGANFAPGAQVSFSGSGIFAVGPAVFKNATEIRVKVNVLAGAATGGRDVIVTNTNQRSGIGKGLLNVTVAGRKAEKKTPPTVIAPNFPPLETTFKKGRIYLRRPEWGSDGKEVPTDHGIPLVDDDLVFTWEEQNKGTADFFELRFYSKDGQTLLLKHRIMGVEAKPFGSTVYVVPAYFRPDAAFIAQLMAKVKINNTFFVNPAKKGKGNGDATVLDGDLQWEVAGFRVFKNKQGAVDTQPSKGASNKFGVQKNVSVNAMAGGGKSTEQDTELEVELSDRWPLGKPKAPTGLNCGSAFGSGLNVIAVGQKTWVDEKGVKQTDPNGYPGDPYLLTGKFDLAKAPYAVHPTEVQTAPKTMNGQIVSEITLVQFDNVFVDWGDGHIFPLKASPTDAQQLQWNRNIILQLPQDATNDNSFVNKYERRGNYTVRVFQLAEADAQKINPDEFSASMSDSQSPYQAALKLMSGSGGRGNGSATVLHKLSAAQQPSATGAIADRAYMLFCTTVTITEREDTDATGSLHLDSIQVTGFPGHDPAKASKVGVSGDKKAAMSSKAGSVLAGSSANSQADGKSAAMQMTPAALAGSQAALTGTGSDTSNPNVASCSQCDDSMVAQAKVKFYGRGRVRITWLVDGQAIPGGEVKAIGPSERRTNLGSDKSKWGDPILSEATVTSPPLPKEKIGSHLVHVEAEVLPEPPANITAAVTAALAQMTASSGGAGKNKPSASAQKAPTTAPSLGQMGIGGTSTTSGGVTPVKIGFLSPSKEAAAGMPTVVYADSVNASFLTKLPHEKPYWVYSARTPYAVVASDPRQPCTFLFPTKDGNFKITGLQNHLTKNGDGTYTGSGNLVVQITNSPSSAKTLPAIPVKFANWTVGNGETVTAGTLDVSPSLELVDTPGVTGTLDQLKATAGAANPMLATLSLELKDNTLRLPGSEKVPSWPKLQGALTADGNWYKNGLTLPQIIIGWSSFKVSSSNLAIDLSRTEGAAASSACGSGTGKNWVGVHLGDAVVYPYTMDLVASNALQPKVTDWGVVDLGLCGKLSTGPFTANLSDGSVHFDSIDVDAHNGQFNAKYKGMVVHVPWLDVDLKGDAKLQSGGGKQASIQFPFPSIPPVGKKYTNVSLTAKDLIFTQEENLGWTVQSNTSFDFTAENGNKFANFSTPLFYGMDGKPYFSKAGTTSDVTLGGASRLGETPLDLASVHLTAPKNSKSILEFAFRTKVHLSEVMPAADMQVNYAIQKDGKNYSAWGPRNAPFVVNVAFPAASPTIDTAISPEYAGTPATRYYGSVDVGMFGGPPIKAEFLLGYEGAKDFWLTRASVPLGSTGVTLVPPYMSLYAIRGGLGHNFPLDAFKSAASIKDAQPVFDNSVLFMAGMRVGSPDSFAYTLDGDFSVKIGGADAGARMDYHAWLLSSEKTGNGDFAGYFQYAGGSFDGELWGGLGLLNGAVAVEIPKGAASLHFGGGSWHIYAGRKEGPRIKGKVLIAQADAYVMIGSDVGLAVGGSQNVYLGVGDSGVASAWVSSYMDIGVQVTPQPKVIGDWSQRVSAGVCAMGACVDAGVNASVHAEAFPIDIRAKAKIEMPTPLPDVKFSVHL